MFNNNKGKCFHPYRQLRLTYFQNELEHFSSESKPQLWDIVMTIMSMPTTQKLLLKPAVEAAWQSGWGHIPLLLPQQYCLPQKVLAGKLERQWESALPCLAGSLTTGAGSSFGPPPPPLPSLPPQDTLVT